MNCDLLQSVFIRRGYQVFSATSGREGLELFKTHRPRVTLLDLRMPEMDGLTVLKEIRALDPGAAVIILGGGATEVQENKARELRVTDFLRKGLSLDVLVGAVNQAAWQPWKPQPATLTLRPVQPGSDEGESILVVDDEPLVRDLLVQFLSLRGYRVRGANGRAEALAMIAESQPHLILLDLLMPVISGVELLQELRHRDYPGGVIVMTASQNEELLEEAWALEPQEVLTKPIDLDRLLVVVQLVLVCREG